MKHHISPARIITPLIVAGAIMTAVVPGLSQAAPADQALNAKQKADDRRKIGQSNDFKLRGQDSAFPEQAKLLAEQYRQTAQRIASQGGNPQPLLDAAANLETQSDVIVRARQTPTLPIQVPQAAVVEPKQPPAH
jgi:hypothetical protein